MNMNINEFSKLNEGQLHILDVFIAVALLPTLIEKNIVVKYFK